MAEDSRRWTAGRLLKVVGLVPIGLLFLVFLVFAVYSALGLGYYGVDLLLAVLWMVVCAALYGLARLAWRFPIAGGVLITCPIAFPIGFVLAGLSLTSLDPPSQVAFTFGIFFGLPLVSGVALLAGGLVERWVQRAPIRENVSGGPGRL